MKAGATHSLLGTSGAIVSACPIFRAGLRELLGVSLPTIKLRDYESIPSGVELQDLGKPSTRWCILADTGRPDQPFSDWDGVNRLRSFGFALVALVPSLILPPTEKIRTQGVTEILTLDATGAEMFAALQRSMQPTTSRARMITDEKITRLSQAELNVAIGIAQGDSLKEIAVRQGISEKTVTSYKSRIMVKLNAENNADLYRMLEVAIAWMRAEERFPAGSALGAGAKGR